MRVVGLLPRSERGPEPLASFDELRERQSDLQERLLGLVAFDPYLVEQANLLLDQLQLVSMGFCRAVRAQSNTQWEKRLATGVEAARIEGRREALHDWVHTRHPDEAIDHAAGRLIRFVLGWSGDSGKSAKAAVQILADLEAAWPAWAAGQGLDTDSDESAPEPEPEDEAKGVVGGER